MSRPSQNKNKEIENFQELVTWFKDGCTDKKDLLIGTENEKIIFYKDNLQPPPYEGKDGRFGIKDVLEKIRDKFGWEEAPLEDGNLVGLMKNGANISLEPGGQLELSGAPLKNLHQTSEELNSHLSEVNEVLEELGMGAIALGYNPINKEAEIPVMPKSRYEEITKLVESDLYNEKMDKFVSSCTVQVNLGYTSEADMIKKLRVGIALQPIISALFANSPFLEGEVTDFESIRSEKIRDGIGGRYGFMLPVAFEDDFSFEKYTKYALHDLELFGYYDGEKFIGDSCENFAKFIQEKEIRTGQKATIQDWENHLNTIWPEVRLRKFLEMRGADVGSAEMIKALPAVWVGLLYDEESLNTAYQMIEDWSEEDREALRKLGPKDGLNTEILGVTVNDLAKNLLALSNKGLKNRAVKNELGEDESVYLKPLHEIVESKQTYSTRLKAKMKKGWNGNFREMFNDCSYKANPSIVDPSNSFNDKSARAAAPKTRTASKTSLIKVKK